MAFDQRTRNRLQKFVNDARNLLTEEFTRQLQATYGLDPKAGSVAAVDSLTQLDNRQRQTANVLRDTLAHYLATTHGKGEKDRTKQALSRIVREQAFTVLNRLAALRMAEARGFLLETIAKGYNAKGFQLYKQLAGSSLGETGEAYRNYLYSVFDEFSLDLAVLFDRHSAQGRLFPRESALLELLDLINHHEIEPLWAEDETIGWIYQYFNSQEERKKMRAESQAPRNSRELAVRNQFFTPRYVVEFLTDNTLGRIWYEMTQGKTSLIDSCRYLVRRPTEVFLKPGELAPEQEKAAGEAEALSQEELLKQPVYIPHRAIKDPRCIRMLDPACGSMHFGLYAFDLYERIYEEAWQLEAELGAEAFVREDDLKPLHQCYESFESYRTEIPRLIIEHNIHGVDIDPRAVQIAGLSLWQRAQRAWQQQGIKPKQRPVVRKSNIVCAEPMPGEKALLQEFSNSLNPPVLGQLLEAVFDKMELAGEAGTLLKIEEEIQSSIHEARSQWQTRSGANSVGDMFPAELDQATPQKELGFDISGVDDETFWDGAEQLILVALSDYADKAELKADQKRLFVEDAAKGFAFIDLCRKRFDVVLMNPPFGRRSEKSKKYYDDAYSTFKPDIGLAFVDKNSDALVRGGKLGALTSRTFLSGNTFNGWRQDKLYKTKPLTLLADLGIGVLDDAMVETAAYVISNQKSDDSIFIRALETRKKQEHIAHSISSLKTGVAAEKTFFVRLHSLSKFPLAIAAYWIPEKLLKVIHDSGTLLDYKAATKHGVQTTDDFQFMRLCWEVPNRELSGPSKRWPTLAKGGEYSPYIDNLHLCVDWLGSGEKLRAYLAKKRLETQGSADWTPWMNSHEYYFQEGLTFPARTASDFSPRILPKGCVFTASGQALLFKQHSHALCYLAASFTRSFKLIVEAFVGSGDNSVSGSAANTYRTGLVNALPVPYELNNDQLADYGFKLIQLASLFQKVDETSRHFAPEIDVGLGNEIGKMIEKQVEKSVSATVEALDLLFDIDRKAQDLFGLDTETILELFGPHPCEYPEEEVSEKELELFELADDALIQAAIEKHGTKRQFTKKAYFFNRRFELLCHVLEKHPSSIASGLLRSKAYLHFWPAAYRSLASWLMGIILGRWDEGVFHQAKELEIWNELGEYFVSSHETVGILEQIYGEGLRLDRSSEEKISVIWGNVEKFKAGLSDGLGNKTLEEYFSKTSLFFSHHYSSYSESRRNAPIYWPLQTPSGSYTLWVYYHRLSEQTLYTCVNDFVEPKLQQVEQDINTLRGKAVRNRQEEKDLEKLSDLAIDLRDFRDEMLRIAKFWKPNLNDGVQITAAPLWKLFQHKAWQKKLKETWERLEKGDYEWAHLAYSIWPERVLRKCHQDRSLAIAHDVEDTFWHEVEVPVMRGKKATGETKLEWQPKELTDDELDALIQAKIKEMRA